MNFTREKYRRLKRLYNEAVKFRKASFQFEDGLILTSYAGYLLDYLSTRFK